MASVRERYPPTDLQERWIAHYTPDRFRRVHLVSAVRCTGSLDRERLRLSIEGVVARHAILRAVVARSHDGSAWIGVVDQPVAVTLSDLQLADVDIHDVVDRFRIGPFDLESGPLFRVGIGGLGSNRHLCVLVVHHMIADGWSLGVFWSDVLRHYHRELNAGEAVQHGVAPPLQFTDEMRRRKEWLASPDAEQARAYWVARLGLCREPVVLPQEPAHRLDPGMPPVAGSLDAADCEKLVQAARHAGVSFSSAVLAAFAIVLAAWGAGADVVTWVCHTGRRRREAMQAIGCFLDMWLLSVRIEPGASPGRTVAAVNSAMVEALPALGLPGVEIGKVFSQIHGAHHRPAAVFNFLPMPKEGGGHAGDGSLVTEPIGLAMRERYMPALSGLTLFITVRWDKSSLNWTLFFDPAFFDDATVERASRYFGRVLAWIAADSGDPLPAWNDSLDLP